MGLNALSTRVVTVNGQTVYHYWPFAIPWTPKRLVSPAAARIAHIHKVLFLHVLEEKQSFWDGSAPLEVTLSEKKSKTVEGVQEKNQRTDGK